MPDAAGLHYLDAGRGEPALVLLHAFPFPAAMWAPQLEGLADRCRVVAPDLPPVASLDDAADAVAGLLEHLGLTRVTLGGLSMGGYVAFSLLRRHRPLVGAVVLADTRAGADTDEVRERRTRQQEQVSSEGTGALVSTMADTLLGEHTHRHRPDVVEQARTLMACVSPDAVVAFLEAMKRRPDSSSDLASIDLPALVVVGEEDRISPPDVAREMHAQLPDAHLALIPQAGHLSNLENPEAFNAEVGSFLDQRA